MDAFRDDTRAFELERFVLPAAVRRNPALAAQALGAALTESQRLIKYRLNAMPGMSSVGPGTANPYFPGNGGQAPNAPAGQGQPQGGGAHPPGNYNYDPATGNLEPVK